MEEQPGYHKQAEQQKLCMVSSFTDSNNGTAVGSGGTILRTTDGGTIWTSTNKRNNRNIICCQLYRFRIMVRAVGVGGTILRTIKRWNNLDHNKRNNRNTCMMSALPMPITGTAVGGYWNNYKNY